MNLKAYQYKRMLEERRGYNFEYWTEKHEALLLKGWQLFEFESNRAVQIKRDFTYSVFHAKEAVENLRASDHFARIVCGYEKNQQRQKTYTVIFKKKPA